MNGKKFTKVAPRVLSAFLIGCLLAIFVGTGPVLGQFTVVTRHLPAEVIPGEEFNVTITWTAPETVDEIGTLDYAPEGWMVVASTAWCTPPADTGSAIGNVAEYDWYGSYYAGTNFTVVYKVQVPVDAMPGTYTFSYGWVSYRCTDTGIWIAQRIAESQVEVVPATLSPIGRGVAWLVQQQNEDGSWGKVHEWGQEFPVAKTALAVLKLAEHAVDEEYGPGLGHPLDPDFHYHKNLIMGLDYLLQHSYYTEIGSQTHGNPDTDDDGWGVCFVSDPHGTPIYETSIALLALCASRAPELYWEMAQDAVDYLAWAQTDGDSGRGGWDYEPMDNAGGRSDNSISGWVTLGLTAAESPEYGFGCTIPYFVRSELNIWIDYIQNDVDGDQNDGGSGYEHPESWVNVLKTGNLIQQMAFCGDTVDTQRVQDAIYYIKRYWYDDSSDPGWRGTPPEPACYHATFTVMKGLETFGIDVIDGIDWFTDISDVLRGQQNWDGSWPSSCWDELGEQILSTEWALLTLQKVSPPPSPPPVVEKPPQPWSVGQGIEVFVSGLPEFAFVEVLLGPEPVFAGPMDINRVEFEVPPLPVGLHPFEIRFEGETVHLQEVEIIEVVVEKPPQPWYVGQTVEVFISGLPDSAFVEVLLGPEPVFAGPMEINRVEFGVPPLPVGLHPFEIVFEGETVHFQEVKITVPNQPPLADAGPDITISEGDSLTLDGTESTDPDDDPLTGEWYFAGDIFSGLYVVIEPGPDPGQSPALLDDFAGIATLTVSDGQGGIDNDTAKVAVLNVAPVVETGPDGTINEGGTFSSSGSFTDPGADTWNAAVNYGDGSGIQPLTLNPDNTFNLGHIYDDNGVYTVAVTVTDDDGGVGTDTVLVAVNNVAPTIGPITAPIDPVAVGAPITASATFTDSGTLDTHTAEWDWGDGITPGTVEQGAGFGTVTDDHIYSLAGVYTITLTVTDDDGGVGTAVYRYVVVYDPEGGFVTGGGWIDSPAGAYSADLSLSGKANFGFVSKYKKGTTTPTGNTEFQFKAGDLNFHSSSYDWLVIAGHKAMYKGTGTINGEGNYGFMLCAIDEKLTPSTDVDMFRMKIWDKDNGDVIIYDNQMGDSDDAEPATVINGGSIVIHRK